MRRVRPVAANGWGVGGVGPNVGAELAPGPLGVPDVVRVAVGEEYGGDLGRGAAEAADEVEQRSVVGGKPGVDDDEVPVGLYEIPIDDARADAVDAVDGGLPERGRVRMHEGRGEVPR